MTQFGVAIAAEGVVEAPLKTGDLAIVRNIISQAMGDEPAKLGDEVLAEYRDDHCEESESLTFGPACNPNCCRWWCFLGTDYTSRPSEVVVVRRVKVVDIGEVAR